VLTRFPTFASWMNEANDARTADISSCATSTPFGSTNSSRERVASSLVARRVPSLVSLLVPVVCPLSCVCVFVCLCLCARAPLSLSHSDVRRQRDRRLLHVRLSTVSSRTSRTSPREQSVSRVRVRRHARVSEIDCRWRACAARHVVVARITRKRLVSSILILPFR
jgi:hypothetical protein